MDQLMAWWQAAADEGNWIWFKDVAVLTGFATVVWGIWRLVLGRLKRVTSGTRTQWDAIVLFAVSSPISTVIWLWPISYAIGSIIVETTGNSIEWMDASRELLAIVILVWAGLRLLSRAEKHLMKSDKRDQTTVAALANIMKLLLVFSGVLSILQQFGVSLTGLLTFGGVGGLIVGLAAKDLLSNFFGGLMIYFDRPFKVGDWVRSPDRNIEGTVERIGMRMTIIRTFDKRPLYVPNSVFSSIVVENPSRMLNRRIRETMGLRYKDADKMDKVIAEVKAMLANHPDIDTNQTLIVNFDTFGASSLDFFIYTFTKTVNWVRFHEVKQDVLLKVVEIVHRNGADFAFPTQTLTFEQGALVEAGWPQPEHLDNPNPER